MPANLRFGAITSILVLAATAASAAGAVLINSSRYEQNFDRLATSGTGNDFGTAASGTEGWVASRILDGGAIASYKTIQSGDSSFSPANASLDRYACVRGSDVAFGARQGTNYAFAIGVLLRNASAAPITRVQVSSVLELWRQPNPSPSSLNPGWLDWGIGPGTMSETNSPPWLGANYSHVGMPTFHPLSSDPLYRTYDMSASLDDLAWNPGETLVLRWYFPSTFAPNTTATSPVLALDDVRLTFTGSALPEPSGMLLGLYVTCTALTARLPHRRSDRSAGAVCRRTRLRRKRC